MKALFMCPPKVVLRYVVFVFVVNVVVVVVEVSCRRLICVERFEFLFIFAVKSRVDLSIFYSLKSYVC